MSADPCVVEAISRVAIHIAETTGAVTADDVRKVMPHAPFKRSTFGAAFQALVSSHQLESIGWTPSKIPQNHGRQIQVYRPRRVRACP